jgi:hypothetical protein
MGAGRKGAEGALSTVMNLSYEWTIQYIIRYSCRDFLVVGRRAVCNTIIGNDTSSMRAMTFSGRRLRDRMFSLLSVARQCRS